MLKLVEINEQNWLDVRRLSVSKDQEGFLDSAVGILARGYVYRGQRARVLGIERDGEMIGIALVKDLDEEPACYDLQQFLIDGRYQGRGYGAEALGLLLELLRQEKKYEDVEVCVHREDAAALALFTGAGFLDTGYVDPDAPDCLNLMLRL